MAPLWIQSPPITNTAAPDNLNSPPPHNFQKSRPDYNHRKTTLKAPLALQPPPSKGTWASQKGRPSAPTPLITQMTSHSGKRCDVTSAQWKPGVNWTRISIRGSGGDSVASVSRDWFHILAFRWRWMNNAKQKSMALCYGFSERGN